MRTQTIPLALLALLVIAAMANAQSLVCKLNSTVKYDPVNRGFGVAYGSAVLHFPVGPGASTSSGSGVRVTYSPEASPQSWNGILHGGWPIPPRVSQLSEEKPLVTITAREGTRAYRIEKYVYRWYNETSGQWGDPCRIVYVINATSGGSYAAEFLLGGAGSSVRIADVNAPPNVAYSTSGVAPGDVRAEAYFSGRFGYLRPPGNLCAGAAVPCTVVGSVRLDNGVEVSVRGARVVVEKDVAHEYNGLFYTGRLRLGLSPDRAGASAARNGEPSASAESIALTMEAAGPVDSRVPISNRFLKRRCSLRSIAGR